MKTTLARVLGVHTDERAWRIGADGEELVAVRLVKAARKDPRWRFLHAIPVGERGSDIDHLIVGPGGVFTVNAKHHPKANIWVGGNTLWSTGTGSHTSTTAATKPPVPPNFSPPPAGSPFTSRGSSLPSTPLT